MITRIPALEYLGRSLGLYKEEDGDVELTIGRVGYGFSVSMVGEKGISFCGVIGSAGEALELHALIGLPNVYTYSWHHAFTELSTHAKVQMQFKAREDSALEITFAFSPPHLEVIFSINGMTRATYCLRNGAQPTLPADVPASAASPLRPGRG